MSKAFRLKGKHVLMMLATFFGFIFATNAVFVTLAVRSFPGQEAAKPYMQGLRFNDEIERRKAEEALGWTASVDRVERIDGEALFVISMRDRLGAPVIGLSLEGQLRRPTHDGADRNVVFETLGDGAYRGAAIDVAAGLWDLRGVATGPGGETFRIETRVVLQ